MNKKENALMKKALTAKSWSTTVMYVIYLRKFKLSIMKKIIAKIIVWLTVIAIAGFVIYLLYVKPYFEIETNGFWEGVLLFIILTGCYTITFFLLKGLFAVITWAVDNAE